MSAGSVVVFVVLAVLAASLSTVAVRAWRDPGMVGDRVPMARTLPFSKEARSAFGRALVPWSGIVDLVVVVGIVVSVRSHQQPGSAAYRDLRYVGLAVAAGIVACFAAMLTVAWFNVPGFLVPPHRRQEKGLFMAGRTKAGRKL